MRRDVRRREGVDLLTSARLLPDQMAAFSDLMASFDGLGASQPYDVSALRADSNWPWAAIHGVYVFVREDEVVYVGRALGTTIGQRLWSHLRSLEEPAWADVIEDPATRVEVIAVDADYACLSAALEVYLIERFNPQFNRRAC